MKPFASLKFWMPVLGLGGFLLLAPQARAQSEISPDHFDGTDSWAIALAAKAPAVKASATHPTKPAAVSALAAQNNKPGTQLGAQATPQLTPAKGVSDSPRPEVLAIQRNRQTAPGKPKNQ